MNQSRDSWRIVKDEWGYRIVLVRGFQEFDLLGAHFRTVEDAIAALHEAPITYRKEEPDGQG